VYEYSTKETALGWFGDGLGVIVMEMVELAGWGTRLGA
jgi:hypothetical protein